MRKLVSSMFVLSLAVTCSSVARSGEDDGRAVVKKAIAAAGGEAKLAKFQSMTFKEKGVYYGQGKGLPYEGVYAMQFPNQFKMEILGIFTLAFDGAKGWTKSEKGVSDMSKEQIDAMLIGHKAGWVASLVPLKDKAFTIKLAKGTDKETAVEVTRKDYPNVKLYFDKKTDLLVRSEFRTKVEEQKFKEVSAEITFSEYKTVDGCQLPHRSVVKYDGKLFVESDVTEYKAGKIDAKTFAKPAN